MSLERTPQVPEKDLQTNPRVEQSLALLTGNLPEKTLGRHLAFWGAFLVCISIPMVESSLKSNSPKDILFGVGLTYLGLRMIFDAKDKLSTPVHSELAQPIGIRKKNLLYLKRVGPN